MGCCYFDAYTFIVIAHPQMKVGTLVLDRVTLFHHLGHIFVLESDIYFQKY